MHARKCRFCGRQLVWPTACMKVLILLLCLSVALNCWNFLKGNQQIIALPLAYFLGVSLWTRLPREVSGKRGKWQRQLWRKRIRLVLVGVGLSSGLNLCIMLPRALGSVPSRVGIRKELDLADSLAIKGFYDRAIDQLRKIQVPALYTTEKARLHHNLGVLLLRKGKLVEAREHLLVSLRFNPSNVLALYSLALVAIREERYNDAMTYLEASVQIRPNFEKARRLLEQLRRTRKDH